jgi:thioredoxin 1
MNPLNPSLSSAVLIVCLCAEWCGVCRDYRSRFQQVQAKFPLAQFLWVDVEDDADLLHPLDVEDFPTLLLAVGDAPRFFGPVTPQPEMLERLIRSQTEDSATPALADLALTALVARLRAKPSVRSLRS